MVSLVGYEGEMSWHTAGKPHGIIIEIPPIPESLMPCKWVWVFKLTHVI